MDSRAEWPEQRKEEALLKTSLHIETIVLHSTNTGLHLRLTLDCNFMDQSSSADQVINANRKMHRMEAVMYTLCNIF